MLCLEDVTGGGSNQASSLNLKWRVALERGISEPTWKCGLLQSESHLLLLTMIEGIRPMHKEHTFPPRFLEPDNWRFLMCIWGDRRFLQRDWHSCLHWWMGALRKLNLFYKSKNKWHFLFLEYSGEDS